MAERQHLFWTPYAAHCIDLMLEEIGKNIPQVKIALKMCRAINAYIYSCVALVNLMRRFTNQRQLYRPAVTRFATSFITFSSIHKQKTNLRKMQLLKNRAIANGQKMGGRGQENSILYLAIELLEEYSQCS